MKTHIGPYRIEAILGRGGMGVVYRGLHEHLGRQVAIKALVPELTQQPEFKQRFFAEAKTQARLQHSNIVGVHDLLEDGGEFFIVMEFVAGEPLDDRLQREAGGLPLATAVDIFGQMLAALDYAHSEGVIHRDIKPSNVLVTESGRIKLTDFGIALLMGDKRLTASQSAIGTPTYMSPEQISRPRSVDHRTDIYSAAVVFFEMLAGRPPFDDDTEYGIKKLHVEAPPPDLGQLRALPAALVQAVAKALAKNPDDRYASAGLFLRDLTGAVSGVVASPPAPLPAFPKATVLEPQAAARPAARPASLPAPATARAVPMPWIAGGGALLAALVLLAVLLARSGNEAPPALAPAVAETAAAAGPPPLLPAAVATAPAADPLPAATPTPAPNAPAAPNESGLVGATTKPLPLPPPVAAPAVKKAAPPPAPPKKEEAPPAPAPEPPPAAPPPAAVAPGPPALPADEPAPAKEGVEHFTRMKELTDDIYSLSEKAAEAQEKEAGGGRLANLLDNFHEAAEDVRDSFRATTGTGLKGTFKKLLKRDSETSEAAAKNLRIKIDGLTRKAAEIAPEADAMNPEAKSYWQEISRYLKELKRIS